MTSENGIFTFLDQENLYLGTKNAKIGGLEAKILAI